MIKGGVGGSKTNLSGLAFEKETSLAEALKNSGFDIHGRDIFLDGIVAGRLIEKNELYVFLQERDLDWKSLISAKLLPDEAIFSNRGNSVTIVEKKWQSVSGSVDEKLQTCGFKIRQYSKLFDPIGIKMRYVYLLNDWFAQPKYADVLEYIRETGADYHFKSLPLELLDL